MRRLERLRLPAPERRAPLPLPRLQEAISAITSGTLFASHKMPLRAYLAAIAVFMNEVKGKSAPWPLSRDLGTSYKTTFVLCHKLREAMAEEMKGRIVGGEGKIAEVDGGYFGGYVKPGQPQRKPRRSPLRQEPERQAQGRHHHSRARRQFGPRRVPHGEPSGEIHQAPASPRERPSTPTKRRHGMACTARSK